MKKIAKKWVLCLGLVTTAIFMFTNTASAHVSVAPEVSAPGAWQTYTIKVPVEKEVATTKVSLKVPADVEIMSYQPIPEWKVTLDNDSSGKIKIITWEATGEGIATGQFQQFNFVAKNPEKETQAAWDAFQYYKDGSIVEWNGDVNSDFPHSITKITTTNVVAENTIVGHDQLQEQTKSEETENKKSITIIMTLSIAALILSVISLLISIRKK